ncbi:hypothetical protein CDO52_16900 [Nocardiopsis gilva YIM 90087]|uniref:Thioredoxin-like fold domain-containing protein n=1 Tax=Nocardiopsis gilva YIM 90087 TaxID=1235441 RepID=A0A223S831_9ACTN|nr:hypothetical protein [Nocardiopsis gilva]ASU84249.1 hypothetical protein CDO52_16900 [Nocardiopsis gilva YIM 90087]
MRHVLRVFVAPGCLGCGRALDLVERVRRARPDQPVEVIDLAHPADCVPASVIGAPTFLLGDRMLSQGNPAYLELLAELDDPDTGGTTDLGDPAVPGKVEIC